MVNLQNRDKSISLRDWFAGQALSGLLGGSGNSVDKENYSEVVKKAYEIADFMLKERKKHAASADG